MTTILYLSDNNLLIQKADSLSKSQGYVWLKEQLYFDLDVENNPVNHCRIEPQKINNHYWQQCSQTAIAKNPSGMRHAADLIWQHITRLKQAHNLEQVILVVPSHYHQPNLQLLLGIFQACDIRVISLVNKAIVELSNQIKTQGRYLHIDMQLHQTVCSEVIAENNSISLGNVQFVQTVGLQLLQDNLLKMIQAQFIKVDRFDPLHYAETEQQLFDQLAKLAERFHQQSKANVVVAHNAQQHSITIEKAQWDKSIADSMASLNQKIDLEQYQYCYVQMNGFEAITEFANQQSSLRNQLPDYTTVAKQYHNDSQQVVYQTEQSLALDKALEQQSSAASIDKAGKQNSSEANSVEQSRVTHLLLSGVATELANAALTFNAGQISFDAQAASNIENLLNSGKLFVVGDAGRTMLRVGDRLASEMADGVITAIYVKPSSVG